MTTSVSSTPPSDAAAATRDDVVASRGANLVIDSRWCVDARTARARVGPDALGARTAPRARGAETTPRDADADIASFDISGRGGRGACARGPK